MFKKKFILIALVLFSLSLPVMLAKTEYIEVSDLEVYLGGDSIGIDVQTNVEIIGMYQVNGKRPWNNKLEENDIIIKVDGKQVRSAMELKQIINESNGKQVLLTVCRDNRYVTIGLNPIESSMGYSLGIYVKDSLKGVGTLTYVVPDYYVFGALGHNLNETQNNITGSIRYAEVVKIKKAERNKAGEKQAITKSDILGNIGKNEFTGIFGKIEHETTLKNKELIEVGTRDNIKLGKAYIYTNITDSKVEKFEIKITDLNKQTKQDVKGIEFQVVDKNLLKKTGGIIQGMSGSPIVQNGKLIGAVTHVQLNDPTKAYGVYIEWMLLENNIKIS